MLPGETSPGRKGCKSGVADLSAHRFLRGAGRGYIFFVYSCTFIVNLHIFDPEFIVKEKESAAK